MRAAFAAGLAAALLLAPAPAGAAEKGLAIRAGELRAEPFVDAPEAGEVAASQPVTIVARRGGWAQVEAGGRTGWIRLLNLRLEPGTANAEGGRSASLLRTGSSGRTVTTGVKGMDETTIRNATVDTAELAELDTLVVGMEEARANATRSQLRESEVKYLPKGKGK